METAPLKSFATWARRELMTQVSARLTAVLAPASPERVESQRAVTILERDIAAAGGGAKGKDAVADKVAYTWFNRIVALRFMDANGYTGVGVVSPAHGQQTGQPEILADAKRGSIDPAVVSNKRTLDAITGLLDGTRPSADAQGEAYSLLLAEYCRYWNRSMPFMFEREGDYTELLIPANLLAADSILSKAASTLTAEVCRDVEVIGWLYQFYISERKDEVFAGFQKGKKAGAAEIPAATQLFTPHWIVRYLVENSLGRLWMLNHPASRLVEKMAYYIGPVDEQADFLKIGNPEELKIIDPACGSGHMLTYAFDLLHAIYEEEGYAPSEIPGLILNHNIHGTEIDPRAGALAAFALTMKARAKQRTFLSGSVQPNIGVIEPIVFSPEELDYLVTEADDKYAEHEFWNQFADADTFGSLIQPDPDLTVRLARHLDTIDDEEDILRADALNRAHQVIRQAEFLLPRYSAVVANPPYMGTRNMSDELRSFAEYRYAKYAGDLCTMFVATSLGLTLPSGLAALVVSESWLFNTTYEEMRHELVRQASPVVTACIDKSAFGVRLNTAATIFRRSTTRARSQFFRVPKELLASGPIRSLPPTNDEIYTVQVSDFTAVPGGAFVFDMPEALLSLYGKTRTVGDVLDVKQGLATADNGRFVRFWWEVGRSQIGVSCRSRAEASKSGLRWFPYNKGGTPLPWWGNQDYVVNWQYDGREVRAFGTEDGGRPRSAVRNPDFYFRSSVTWSNIGSGGARFRLIPPGFVFDVAGMSAFAPSADSQLGLLGYLNSTIVRAGLDVLAPTLNYQVGDVARLPMVSGDGDAARVERLVELARADWAESETAHEFGSSPLVDDRQPKLSAGRATVAETRSARVVQIAQLERASDAYWMDRVADLAGRSSSESFAHVPRDVSLPTTLDDSVDLVSYSIGCMFGRYSLDEPGLLLADQGATIRDYLTKVPTPKFMPDPDNVLPIVDGDWFEDDIVARFRQFLRAAFGEQHFDENLRFVEESLGVKTLREYFITRAGRSKFYDDHVKRYKKRPIYWLFSSPKGSFNALIYMHRYTPSTVSTVLNEYLREFESKLEANLQHQERLATGEGTPREKAAALKEAERLRKVLLELGEYEHDVLYPLASQQVAIDLDDGVKANYPKFYPALKKIAGLEAADD